ncbi:hypothetical protein NQ315_015200 [Exocentrus adspersus]|uniref:VWFA domain-containing protein n=1 Tax=Exocentrus adspersus TaxID=1586481 RepID=A0AAV8VIN3_9CUCU|nr:hypothetical protein NQ315_015200 [Exocentrus adspersus]
MKLAVSLILYVLSSCCVSSKIKKGRDLQLVVKHMVKLWSLEIGEKLTELSRNMTREEEVEKSFKPLEYKMTRVNGAIVVQNIARDIRKLMDKKADAVMRIAEYAEFLSYHRSNESLLANSTYYFFNADNITNNDGDLLRQEEVANDTLEIECYWLCHQQNLEPLPNNIFSNKTYREQLFVRRKNEKGRDCECENLPNRYRPPQKYLHLPMIYDSRFDENVNLNLSIAKIATNVYEREQNVLEGLRWSEALDLVFKDNNYKDSTLTWQYFASPRGFMRHYPAVQWSDERYYRTYDFRTRTWYTEAITSPKDVIILLDRSGSMRGTRRAMSMQIVNQILDTLNDNDFVNVYTFTNTTEPLVGCFNDTLVQANEENLRLLRENLPVYTLQFTADLTVGLGKAFDILENFRATRTSSKCNQAVMIITEGIDYWYDTDIFELRNKQKGFPIRIFTYQIGDSASDAKELESIACKNMGYWANMTDMGDIREKMLNYLNVMSRNINYDRETKARRKFIWSYLHVDLADRRLSNWLWKKYEGIRQREVFLDFVKRKNLRMKTYETYEKDMNYKYMTTVSLPVYGRREDEVELIGVAGIDVPIDLFKAQIPFDLLGVNGYAFIVTNNGYILMHPDHRTQFKKILKPTFNRVDFVEVEILDDDRDPRLFGDTIVKLREKLVNQTEFDTVELNVKYSLNDMKRLMLAKRHYFSAAVGPFTLGIVLPHRYGFIKINKSDIRVPPWQDLLSKLQKCLSRRESENSIFPKGKVYVAYHLHSLFCKPYFLADLLNSFLYDMEATKWFDTDIDTADRFTSKYIVHKVFLATHSGLFRWKTLKEVIESDFVSFEDRNNQAIDEDWYRRAVEMNFNDESIFIYSVPFETSGYEDNTMITSTKAIFVERGESKTPVAVVGLQFNHRAMYELYNITTKKCIDLDGKKCGYTCESDFLNCFILDNNAYVVLSDEPEFIGRYMGDIRPYIMSLLTEEHVYFHKRMYDYQAICQKLPPENDPSEDQPKVYKGNKGDTEAFEKLAINKTFPTPCDHEMWLYNLNEIDRIPNTNLLFLAINGDGSCSRSDIDHKSPEPLEILYDTRDTTKNDLPCYIATMNNYTRRMYMGCYNKNKKEDKLIGDRHYCGHYWD